MTAIDLHKIKKIHFIGIGGIGISAIARMMAMEGKTVTANDLDEFELVTALRGFGIDTKITTDPSSIPEDTELVIYSIAWNKIAPEILEYVKTAKIPALSYPEVLGLISKNKFTIAVAGTHGKTTTTAMIAHVLIEAGLDPTVIVGSLMKNPLKDKTTDSADGALNSTEVGSAHGSNFISGKSKYFVVEACEYKRSFLNLHPNIAVITNIDEDHLDYYQNLAGVQTGFSEFIDKIKADGVLVTDTGNEKIKTVLFGELAPEKIKDKTVTIEDYNAIPENIVLKIPGQHNIQNAKAALAVALALKIPKEKALQALSTFPGTWRRFEELGTTKDSVRVYDDYAHHPTEISATLLGVRELFPKEKIIVAFQPHLYSRTKEHLHEFAQAFISVDEVVILPIYAARELADPAVSSEILVEEMKKSGLKVSFQPDFDSAAEYIKNSTSKGDVVLTMGAGDINILGAKILA
jgi:UDP-N-acetylmuramate--alanine ligase